MSEPTSNNPSAAQAPQGVEPAARQVASARRRAFIRAGGVAVPTALTLASRPVMAWNCNTASMWGSVVGTTGSAYTRAQTLNQTLFVSESYTQDNWKNNVGRGVLTTKPRTALGCGVNGMPTWSALKRSDITGSAPIGSLGSTVLVKDVIANTSGMYDKYTCLMMVAWLNYVALTVKSNASPGLANCLKPQNTNALVAMGTPGAVGPDGKVWDKTRIVDYLEKNYIALTA